MPIPRRQFMLALGTGALAVRLGSSAHRASHQVERVVKMRTTRALGLTIPQALLLSADRVVE
jgi:hypothetical protein